jgi:ATP-dependent Lhr-like helicase
MIRGLMEVCGPAESATLAAQLGMAVNEADAALEALEGEGVVLRGQFTPGRRGDVGTQAGAAGADDRDESPTTLGESTLVPDSAIAPQAPRYFEIADADAPGARKYEPTPDIEWCHRRLLARIHRLTMEGLRKQIEPVTVDVYLRFLTRYHGLIPGSKRAGAGGLFEVIGMLQGLDLPAIAWERDLFATRLENYRPEWLDELCLTGEVGWGRLFPTKRLPEKARPMASLTRAVPLSIFLRSDLEWLQSGTSAGDSMTLSTPAQDVLTIIRQQGAMFAADLMTALRLLPDQLNDVLGELVSQGFLTADGFAGLRALLSSRTSKPDQALPAKFVRRRTPLAGAGRWALWRRPATDESNGTGDASGKSKAASDHAEQLAARTVVENWAWQLLRRWGVVFRDLLEREPGAPRWFELLQVYRRLEARGEIRGGRFITGVAGEQFAVGDTVRQLRTLRDAGPARELVVISAADPLNLAGILTSHERVPSIASNRLAYVDGRPVAALVANEVRYLTEPGDDLLALLDHGRALRRTATEAPRRPTAPPEEPPPAPSGTRKVRKQQSLFPRSVRW